jgi:glycosyltransferase involved in cell wall biosynthesis
VTQPPGPPPKVSVVIPCYGQARYLPEAVASVVAQTFTDWEIVIVDDGSPDETATVAAALIAQHAPARIRLVRQTNGGVARARNAGIATSQGRFILPLDADNRLEPEFLAATVAVLEADPSIAIAYTDYRLFEGASDVKLRPEWELDRLCDWNYIENTSLFRREAWVASGGYNANMVEGLEDWDFWLSCAEHGYIGQHVPEVLFSYRQRPGSRNEQALLHLDTLRRRIRANHPSLFSPTRRLRRLARRLRVRFLGRVRHFRH